MNRKPDPYGRDATRPYHIPLKGWWQVAQRVWSESDRDNLSVVAAGCAFFALFAIFPALSALISLYGLTADPATVEQHFGMLSSVLPTQAYDMVIEQIHRISAASGGTLGWSLAVSLGLALWSANAGTQAMMAALNIAYEEPERRSLFRYYLNAFTFTIIGILGGVVMLLAILYVPILFAFTGYSHAFELVVSVVRWPFLALFVLFYARAPLPLWPLPPQRQMALGERGLSLRHGGMADRLGGFLALRIELRQLRQDLRVAWRRHHLVVLALHLVLHRSARRRD